MGESHRPNPTQTAIRQIERAERDRQIIELARRGKTTADIARLIGCNPSRVTDARRRALAEVVAEKYADVEYYRAEALERLSVLLDAIWDRAATGDHQHVAEARRIIADMADYTGAKVPLKLDILGAPSEVDLAIQRLDDEIDRRARSAAGETAPAAGVAGRD